MFGVSHILDGTVKQLEILQNHLCLGFVVLKLLVEAEDLVGHQVSFRT